MATTKKKASSKRRVVLKKVTKNKVASKKVTKRAKKKTLVKKSTKKTTPKKLKTKAKITKNKPSTKKVSTSKKKIPKKRKLNVVDVEKNSTATILISNKSISLEKVTIQPSELRLVTHKAFSLPGEYRLRQVARYSGVIAVIVGGFFTLVNLQAITGIDNTPTTSHTATVLSTSESFNSTQSIDSKPEPRVSLGSGGDLNDTVTMSFMVPYANKVEVLVKSLDPRKDFTLGSAKQIDDSTWKFDWNTTQYPDAEYKLRVVITNEYGDYDYVDPKTYRVVNIQNEPSTDSVSSSGDENKIFTDTTDIALTTDPNGETGAGETLPVTQKTVEDLPAEEIPEVILTIPGSTELIDDARLEISVTSASDVQVYARNNKTLNLHFLGFATNKSDSEWEFNWDTQKVINGSYTVYAVAPVEGQRIQSKNLQVTVGNENEDSKIAIQQASTTPRETENILEPEIQLSFSKQNPVSKLVTISTQVSSAERVEIFAIPQNSLILKFLGVSQKDSGSNWNFVWDTTQTPNGEYLVYSRIKTDYGYVEGEKKRIIVKNETITTYTIEEEKHIDQLQKDNTDLIKISEVRQGDDLKNSSTTLGQTKYIDSVNDFVKTVDINESEQEKLNVVLEEYRAKLNELLNELGKAERLGDQKKLESIRSEMLSLKNKIILELSTNVDKKQIADQISSYISRITFELEEITIQNEKILRERVGDQLFVDSDNDTISDYDEINLYKTNPYTADTDNDGFIDSIEIERGYNPNDADSEALIKYESPRETGVTQEDLFSVDSVTTLTDDIEEVSSQKKALITGRGLPNSFVTIYIFSLPVVVTVRTDADGGWRYIFDKELEDGEHEIYVGVTDNAGKIVGKSKPLTFLKTAEAYTVNTTEEVLLTPEDTKTSLIDNRMLLLIASLAVVSLGLVLILLGLHVTDRREKFAFKSV